MIRARSRGQAMAEFALVTPMMLLLILLIVDFGRIFFFTAQMSTAASEAARQAVLYSNRASNTTAGLCPTSCQTAGVVPQVQSLAAFGYQVVYQDSSNFSTPPCYGSYSPNADPNQPGTITLSGCAQPNVVYVFVYQIGTQTSPNPRWACPTCTGGHEVRTAGHQKVVVDVKMNFQPTTGLMVLNGLTVPLDAQSVQRIEW